MICELKYETHEEWLAIRKRYIGGSDASAVVGLNPFFSPYALWAEKTGKLPEKEDSEAMRQGRDLEDYVAKRWEESTGKRVRRKNRVLVNDQYPFAHANIDRLVVGERAGLECKTTSSLNVKRFRETDFPEQYYCQCVHYLAVTGYDRWYLAVLVFGKGFYVYTLERADVEDEIAALMDAERQFWELVQNDTPPAVDGSEATTEAVSAIYADGANEEDEVDLFGKQALLAEYLQAKEAEKAIKERIAELGNALKSELGDCVSGSCEGYRVSWKPQERQIFDAKRFSEDNPGMDLAPYYKTSKTRVLRVTAEKKEG